MPDHISKLSPIAISETANEPDNSTALPETAAPRISQGEFTRKVLHMLPGLFPFVLALIPHPDPLTFDQISFIIQICVVFTAGFLILHRVVRRPGEKNLLSSTLSYPATIVAMLALFPAHAEFATAVVAVLAFGDGAAYFGGKLFGKTKLPWNSHKTWVGTATFVCCAAPMASLAYWVEARPDPHFLLAAICGTSAAVMGAIGESLPTEITDNLRVGVFASIGVVAAHYAFAGWLMSGG